MAKSGEIFGQFAGNGGENLNPFRRLFLKSQLAAQLVGIANGREDLTTLAQSAQEDVTSQKTGGPRKKKLHDKASNSRGALRR